MNKNWKEIKIENKTIFYNTKQEELCFHPPISIENIEIFLDLYKFTIKKIDLINLINSKVTLDTNGDNSQKCSKLINENQINKNVYDLKPISDRN